MSFNSKYKGREVEELLDKVKEGNLDTLKLSFSVVDLISFINRVKDDPTGLLTFPISSDFIEALENNNKVIIPYDIEDISSGSYTLTGHVTKDDELNFTLPINNGDIIYCKNLKISRETPFLNGNSLSIINIINKQDKLISGENISTINGESLLNGRDITIGQRVNKIDPEGMLNKEAVFGLEWGQIHVISHPVLNLKVNILAPGKSYAEASVIFKLSSLRGIIDGLSGVIWANGINPLNSLKEGILYELSISATTIGGETQYNGILVPFNS